jgi:hypothetical protein
MELCEFRRGPCAGPAISQRLTFFPPARIFECMGPRFAAAILFATWTTAGAQQPPAPANAPLPPIRALMLDVDRNMRLAEAQRTQYTYHVHLEQQQLDSHGNVKKALTVDSESVTIDGVRIDRVVAHNGQPLTPDEAKKESDRVDKEVQKAKERRAKAAANGGVTDSRGDSLLPASRILELGSFTNPRRVLLNGRPTIELDFAGDPHAKTRNEFEGVVRDLVGTVWIDEQDHVLARAQGHFLHDFKVAGGLVLDIHQGLSFEAQFAKVNSEVWLPTTIDGQGSARILLVDTVNGRFRLVTSDYRKFRSSSTIVSASEITGTDHTSDQPAAPSPPPRQ